jgi:hypothetical protein
MSDQEKTANLITTETVCKALMQVDIIKYPELRDTTEDSEQKESSDALEKIRNNPAQFEEWLQDRLSALPRVREFFGHLIEARLKQDHFLWWPILDGICDDSSLEQMLERIECIPGIKGLTDDYKPSKDSAHTDQATLDLYAEVLLLDLMIQLGFTDIRKIPKQSKAHVDFTGQYDGKVYAIEITRKKEIEDWTVLLDEVSETGLEDCDDPDNHRKITKLLKRTLKNKNKQFKQSLADGTIDSSMTKVLAIRVSDIGLKRCFTQVQRIARALLSKPDKWSHIDCIWFVPQSDVEQSRWVCRGTIDAIPVPPA